MSGSITLRFKGKVKKICFRQNIPSEDFGCLIASHFDIKKRIIGLKDKQGTMVEIGYFCQKPYEIKPEIYQVIVEDRSHSQSQHRRNYTQSYNFQKQSPPLQNNFLQSAQLGSQIQTSDFASPQQQYLNRSLQVQSQEQRQNSLQQQQQQQYSLQQQQQPSLQSNIQSFQSPYNQTQQSYNNNNNIQNQINTSANYIEDLFEFYEGFLQGDFTQNQKLTAIFILDELTAASILELYNNVIMEFSENADFFYTYNKEQNTSFIFNNINVAIPCLVLYKGNKKVIELSTTNKKDQIIRILHNFTNTIIQPNFSSQLVQNSSLNANNDQINVNSQKNYILQDQDSFQQVIDIQDIQKNIIQYLDKMHSENLLDNPQYYYFTCQAFKNLNNFLKTLFDDLTDISYESFKENLKQQIRNMVRQDNSIQQKQQQQEQQFQHLQQQSQKLQYSSTLQLQISKQKQKNEQDDILDQITSSSNQNQEIPLRLYQEQINKISRPQTTGNQAQRKQKKRNLKKYNPDIDSYIEITEDLIDQNILEEQQGSIIKTFLLEENLEVLRVYNSYLSGIFNEQVLQQKLKDLADKLGSYLERPSSPFPRKFQLIKTINTVLSQYFSPEQIKILNDLAQQGNEMIISAFEVYESDKDFDEFIDTIKRILKVQSSSFFKQSGSSNINTFYVKDNQTNQNQYINFFNQNPAQYQQQQQQQKQQNYNRQNRHQQDLQQQQQQQQQGGFSIFSNPNYKTTNYDDNNNNQVNLNNKNTIQQQEQNQNIFTGQILPNNINNKLFSKEQQFFEFVEANIESIQPEEYGMLQYLYKILDEDLIKMVEQSHLHQKYDLFPIQMLAKQKLNEKMNLEFTKLELKQIYENQANNKTSTYSVYQQFQVEGDLNQFITNLKQALLLDQTQMLNNQLNEGAQSNLKVPVNTVNTNSKMDLFSKQDSFDNGNIFEQETPSLKNQEISDDIQFVKQNSQEVDSAKPYFQNEQKNKEAENKQTLSKQKENNYFQQRQNQINLQKQENFNSFSDSNQKANVNVNINNQSSSIYKINQIQKENKDSLQVNYSNHSSQNMGNGNQKKIIGMNSSLGVISPSSSKKKNLSVVTNSPFSRQKKKGFDLKPASLTEINKPVEPQNNMMSSFSNFAKKKFNEKKQELDQIKEIQPRHQTQISQRQGLFSLNKVRQQQRENYIIKDNDLNEILKNEIENFYNTPHDEFYRDLISEIAQMAEITKKQEQKLLNLLKINHVALHNVLQTYNQNKDIDEIKEDLQLLFEAQATEINKQNIQRFNHFNAILRHLYEDQLFISRRDYNIYIYLFLAEDVSIMSAFESYLVSQDQQEFISTLKLITQISQKKFNLQYDDMESFTDGMLEQMKYVFAFRQEFNFDEQISLEKMIKSLDTQLLPVFSQFKQNKNEQKFINELKDLCKANQTAEKQDLKDIIYHLRHKDMKQLSIMYESVEKNNTKIFAAYELYKLNEDKIDFQENILLIYNYLYQLKMSEKIISIAKTLGASQTQIEYFKLLIEDENSVIYSAYEVYLLKSNDASLDEEEELIETIQICLDNLKEKNKQ